MTSVTKDCTNTPGYLWLLCMMYCCYILNHLAHPLLENRTPIERAFGITPDISALLIFMWYQKILYYDPGPKFPQTKEKLGRFVGIAENTGDALTFLIETNDTKEIIKRSDVRPYEDDHNPNLRVPDSACSHVPVDGESDPEAIFKNSENPILYSTATSENAQLPTFDSLSIIGMTFLREREADGTINRAFVREQLPPDYVEDEMELQFIVEMGDGSRMDVMSYNQILNHLNSQYEDDYVKLQNGDKFCSFRSVKEHKKIEGK